MDSNCRRERKPLNERAQKIPSDGEDETGHEEACDERLDQSQERQLEQEEGDVAAEDRIGDNAPVGCERDPVLPEQHRLP